MSSGENPYAPPETELTDVLEDVIYPAAGGGQRLLNLILDQVGNYGALVVFRTALTLVGEATNTDTTFLFGGEHPVFEFFFGYAFMVGFYTVLEGTTGRTPGKWVTGTKAVMDDGSPLTFLAAFLRSLCRLIPFEAFSFLGQRASGWHDTIPGTMVVNLRAEPRPRHPSPRPARALSPQAPEKDASPAGI